MSRPIRLAAAIGGIWGVMGYLILWGHTPFEAHHRFVASPLGTLVFLPVRAVLFSIRFVEQHIVRHGFEFQQNNWWIGAVATVLGATIAVLLWLVTHAAVRRVRA